jgi:hypothetical protein
VTVDLLGRREPTDWTHVEKYPLSAAPAAPVAVPVVLGINWYSDFDRPVKDSAGQWWVGRSTANLGSKRGGHAICTEPHRGRDLPSWWKRYNQNVWTTALDRGSCTGYSAARMLSLLNRHSYDPLWIYHEAQAIDEYADTPPQPGSSVRAAMDVLRVKGACRTTAKATLPPALEEGIAENRWATSAGEVLDALGTPHLGYVTLLQSWGDTLYPHRVRLPAETLDRLLAEGGEAALVTDR